MTIESEIAQAVNTRYQSVRPPPLPVQRKGFNPLHSLHLLWIIPVGLVVFALFLPPTEAERAAKEAALAVVKQECGVKNSGYWDNERQDCMCGYECIQVSKMMRREMDSYRCATSVWCKE